MNALIKVASALKHEILVATRQLETTEKKSKKGSSKTRDLKEKIEDMQGKVENIEEIMNDIFVG